MPADVPAKNRLFARALARGRMNTISEWFGLVFAEDKAAGVSEIAMDLGSCREVIEDERAGFPANTVAEAAKAAARVGDPDRRIYRQPLEELFSVGTIVEAYERVYANIFEREARRPS